MDEEIYSIVENALKKLNKNYEAVASIVSFNSTTGRNAIRFMKDYGLITTRSENLQAGTIADITELGKDALKVGVINYINKQKANVSEREILELKKLKVDLKNAERISKTYWLTFVMASISFLYSLYTFLLPYLKHR